MGQLIDGQWHDHWYDTASTGGRFVRSRSAYRNWVTRDGSPGPTGEGGFRAEPGRYHLYVSLACPWAHRTLIYRRLKGLEQAISVSVVDPLMGAQGWSFGDTPDPLLGKRYLHEVYTTAAPDFTGRVTVPVLWDRQRSTIVSNESADIIRMLNSAFDGPDHGGGDPSVDFCPEALRPQIDEINDFVYDRINNGVYKAGFATTQAAYEEAFDALFAALDTLDEMLASRRYLLGDRPTEADWRLLTTLLRFDPVYYGHFKCNRQRLADYRNLWGYTCDLYQVPGVADTVDLDHIKRHYYGSHATINPTGIVPKGPAIDYGAPHDRARLGA